MKPRPFVIGAIAAIAVVVTLLYIAPLWQAAAVAKDDPAAFMRNMVAWGDCNHEYDIRDQSTYYSATSRKFQVASCMIKKGY